MKPHIGLTRDPYEVMILLAAFASGWINSFTNTTPGTIAALLPHWFQVAWSLLLAIGATVALVGIARRKRPGGGLSLEAAGVIATATALSVYAGGIISVQGGDLAKAGITAAFTCIAIAIAGVWRVLQIRRYLEGPK